MKNHADLLDLLRDRFFFITTSQYTRTRACMRVRVRMAEKLNISYNGFQGKL